MKASQADSIHKSTAAHLEMIHTQHTTIEDYEPLTTPKVLRLVMHSARNTIPSLKLKRLCTESLLATTPS
ncbi:MAG: hypothetical protein ACK5YR_17170 [Pirellula sp.]